MDELIPAFPLGNENGATYGSEPASSKFQVQKFLLFLLAYWWIPAGVLVLTLALAFVVISRQPTTFVSFGSMWETVKLQLPERTLFTEDTGNSVGTQNDLLQSGLLQKRVFAKLLAATNRFDIPLDAQGAPMPVNVHVSQSAKSAVFVLDATGPQPAYTQAYLEALMQAYLDYKADIRKEISGDTLASISAQVQSAEQELKNQQEILAEFERTNNLAVLQEEGTVAGGYLTKLKTEISDLQANDHLLEAAAADLAKSESGSDSTNAVAAQFRALATVSGAIVSSSLSDDLQNKAKELALLKTEKTELSANLRELHPKIQQLNADIERAENELEIYRRQGIEQLAAARETSRLKMQDIQSAIIEWEARVVQANSRIAEADSLRNNVQRAQGQFDHLSTVVQTVKLGRDFDQDNLTILEHASPAVRSSSKARRTLASALAGGLLLGLSFIGLLVIRDEKFVSAVELEQKIGDCVIAQVPELPRTERRNLLVHSSQPLHAYTESYRCLRSALLYLTSNADRPRMLLITSALPDEGKSTVAANLAQTLALGGARVLLVDADLRRGVLHDLLSLRQEPGLAGVLNQTADVERIFQTNSIPNLSFIACGARLANPGDQFLSTELDQLLNRWRQQFDYVLIDSSPIFAADDATTLASKMDGTLLVVRSRFSNSRQVRSALQMLQQRRARVLGIVFNRANASSHSYDYYKYTQYHFGAAEAGSKAAAG